MSLQVWLPLNGNLNNQGLDAANSISCTSAAYDTNGKIGKCLKIANYSSSYCNISSLNGSETMSCAFWYKPTGSVTASPWSDVISFKVSNSSEGTGVFRLEVTNSSNTGFTWFENGGYICNTSGGLGNGKTLTADTWYHICMTLDGTYAKLYMNGVLSNIFTIPSSCSYWFTGDFKIGDSGSYGSYNDIRIYDHCLSPKEVKEISKGLCLHYPLNSRLPRANMIKSNSMNIYNNYGVTASIKTTGEYYRGAPVYRLTMTPTSDNVSSFQGTLHSHGVYQGSKTFYANTKYCYWIYYKPVTHNDIRVGGTASNIGGWTEIAPKSMNDGWYRVGQYRSGSVTTDKSDAVFTSFYTPTAAAGTPISIDFACPHLVSGYSTIVEDYSFEWEQETIIHDASGYGYNGSISSTQPDFISGDSPRYDGSTYFGSSSSYIVTPTINTSGFANSYTFSWWGKAPSYSSIMFWGFSNGNRLNYYSGLYCNTGDGSNNPFYSSGTTTISAPSTNTWHHFAMVGNGSNTFLYVDGNLYGTAKTYKPLTGTQIYLNGWDSGTSYKTNGYISDFRIYSTALSSSDIKELYNTPVSITNNGALMTQGEVIEQ